MEMYDAAAGTYRLDKDCSPGKFWNYLRRQLCVMDTYASDYNRRLNHGMLALHCYLSWALVVPATITGWQLARCWAAWLVFNFQVRLGSDWLHVHAICMRSSQKPGNAGKAGCPTWQAM